MKDKIRILIVDDHAMVRIALSQAIQQQRDMCLVGEAVNGMQALDMYRKFKPDVVTMDYRLPDRNGVEVTASLLEEFPDARVLLLSVYEAQENIWRAVQAGVAGYFSKAAEIDEVIAAIRRVAAGQTCFSSGLAEKLSSRRKEDTLSPRELDVLQRIVAGESNKEIMGSLHMAQSTVKHHLEQIFAKLHVCDRSQAITAAIQRGIVQVD